MGDFWIRMYCSASQVYFSCYEVKGFISYELGITVYQLLHPNLQQRDVFTVFVPATFLSLIIIWGRGGSVLFSMSTLLPPDRMTFQMSRRNWTFFLSGPTDVPPVSAKLPKLDQIELERSASWQWETGKEDIVVGSVVFGSMSGRDCVVLKKKEFLLRTGIERPKN